jgi:hypothetical protein
MNCTIDEETRAWIKANFLLWGESTEAPWYGSPPGRGCYLKITADFAEVVLVCQPLVNPIPLGVIGNITVDALLFIGKAFGINLPGRDYKGLPNDQ